jgi:hypothetical protein
MFSRTQFDRSQVLGYTISCQFSRLTTSPVNPLACFSQDFIAGPAYTLDATHE